MKMRGPYQATMFHVYDARMGLVATVYDSETAKRIARALNLLEETERKRARMPVLCAPGFADELVGAVKKLERKRAGKGKRR